MSFCSKNMVEKPMKDRRLFPAIPAAASPGPAQAAGPLSYLVATSPSSRPWCCTVPFLIFSLGHLKV